MGSYILIIRVLACCLIKYLQTPILHMLYDKRIKEILSCACHETKTLKKPTPCMLAIPPCQMDPMIMPCVCMMSVLLLLASAPLVYLFPFSRRLGMKVPMWGAMKDKLGVGATRPSIPILRPHGMAHWIRGLVHRDIAAQWRHLTSVCILFVFIGELEI